MIYVGRQIICDDSTYCKSFFYLNLKSKCLTLISNTNFLPINFCMHAGNDSSFLSATPYKLNVKILEMRLGNNNF